ncbi:MAG: hypothetical protein M5U26_17925 [Planctomycetota bacterium]|nr:hypothetical protein [Planctomycetota bacterium]
MEYYRRAIGQARNPVLTPVPTRMKVEPQAWFEMGLSYYKMDHYYESIIAYQALRTIFAKDFRAHWMPDPQKNKELYKNKELTAALAELDKVDENDVRNDGLLHKTEKNIVIALTKNAQTPTRFNKKLKVDIMRSEEFSVPGGVNDTDYQAGKLLMDEARDLQEQGNRFEKAKNNKEAEKQFTQALAKLEEGAKNFAKVQVASKAYEVGLYQAASCYTLAQQILASEKIRAAMKPEEIEAKLKELTELSLGLYKKYEDHVAKEPDNTEEGIERRKKLARGVLLSRTTLHYGAKDWDNVIKSCDEYMEYEKANPSGEGDAKLLTVVFNKFRALSNLAGDKNPPECDAYLEAASKLVPQLKEKDSFYIYALQNISQRYHNALAKAEKARLDQAVIDGYDANIAKYQTAALELKDPNERTLQEWGNLLYYNEKEGKKREACDIAVEMLKRFDPQNRNKQIGDEDEKKEKDIWDTYMTGIKDVIAKGYSSDRTKAFNCLKDHEVLIDYMYDTREGVNNEDVDKRPKHDKYNIDYEKALKQIKTIKQNYPDCPTHKPTHETHYVNGKSYLAMIEDEIEYRRRIIAVRDLLSELALKVGVDFEKAGDQDSAKKYRSIADEQLTVLEEVYGDVPEMKVKSANIKVANGDFQGALDILYALKNKETDTSSARYIDVSKRISEIHFQKGEYNDAADYPKFIAATAGMESNWVKKNWPDMKAFLDKCYDKGVKPLEVVQSKPSDLPVDYRPKSPDETEFEQLKMVFDLAERTPAMSNQLLTPEFLQKYNLLKGKIEHFSEFQKLERLLLTHRGKADEKEIITDAFMARYNAIDELVKVERDAWRAYQKFDQAITEYGGPDKVPDEIKNARANGLTKSKELSEKLKSVPEVKLDDKPKDAKTEPAPETKTETKTEPADAAKTE